jgi:Ni,Fe-hydrogenase III large subunit/Ni,Fe-hydrogenase III component G
MKGDGAMKETWTTPDDLLAACTRYQDSGMRLQTMVATDERAPLGAYVLRYVFVDDGTGEQDVCSVRLPSQQPQFASVTPVVAAADWYEREAQELFGLVPVGHPSAHPLVLHGMRPSIHPLRKDVAADIDLSPVRRTVAAPELPLGLLEVPVGPIHAGIIEPGHFRFRMHGEEVEHLDVTLFYTHRGLEKRAEGEPVTTAMALAQQACGMCTVSHAWSYAQAVEQIMGLEIPLYAQLVRMLVAELERLYNHVADVGNVCAGVGFAAGAMQGAALKERLLRLNQLATGHRYLRDVVAVGGLSHPLDPASLGRIRFVSDDVVRTFSHLIDVLFHHEIFCERMRETGVIRLEDVRRHGVVGLAARASGARLDARRIPGYGLYHEFEFDVPTHTSGDVMARVQQRAAEVVVTAHLIDQILERLDRLSPAVALQHPSADPAPCQPGSWALGVFESARGENVHFVRVADENTIDRLRIRSASYANWPVVPTAVTGAVIADFPLINKSFELCYACCDR